MRSSSFESPKSYLYGHNLKNRKAVLLRYVIFIRSTFILYHKLPKSPVFLQATVTDATRQRVKTGSEQGSYANRHLPYRVMAGQS